MSFKIALSPTYRVNVVVETPKESGGFERNDFTAVFKRVDMKDLEELTKIPQIEIIDRVLIGWIDLLDENDDPVEYNAGHRAALLRIPQAGPALIEAFWNSIYKAREKN